MRTNILLTLCGGLLVGGTALAASNIDSTNKFAWAENVGWLNWRDANGGAEGVEVLADHLRGFIWGENIGWINVGNGGGPYANTDNTNFGVNINPGTGELSGFAWAENVGWINFGTTAAVGSDGATFDFMADRFRGYAWGENIGWINLDDGTHFVGIAPSCPGDANGDNEVNILDLNIVLGNFQQVGAPGIPGDLNEDGVVNILDLNLVLGNFQQSC